MWKSIMIYLCQFEKQCKDYKQAWQLLLTLFLFLVQSVDFDVVFPVKLFVTSNMTESVCEGIWLHLHERVDEMYIFMCAK